MIDLRPCPFCGQTEVDVHTDIYWSGYWSGAMSYVPYAFVVCPHCGAQGPIAQRGTLSEEQCKLEAMRAWERRAKEVTE